MVGVPLLLSSFADCDSLLGHMLPRVVGGCGRALGGKQLPFPWSAPPLCLGSCICVHFYPPDAAGVVEQPSLGTCFSQTWSL